MTGLRLGMFIRHREAALAAVAIHDDVRGLGLDCFAALAMTAAAL